MDMESDGWVELVSYVSDLGSLLDFEIGLDGGSLRIGLDGASITVIRLSEGWAITYENYSEGVRIRVGVLSSWYYLLSSCPDDVVHRCNCSYQLF